MDSLARPFECEVEILEDECAFEIRGPVLGVIEAIKKLQGQVNKVLRSNGQESAPLKTVVPLMPEGGSSSVENALEAEEEEKAHSEVSRRDTTQEVVGSGTHNHSPAASTINIRKSTSATDRTSDKANLKDQHLLSPSTLMHRTSIVSIPDLKGNRKLWDYVFDGYDEKSTFKLRGLREHGVFVIVGPEQIVEKQKAKMQARIDKYCTSEDIPRVFLQSLHDRETRNLGDLQAVNNTAVPYHPQNRRLNLTGAKFSTDQYYIKLALPDNIDPSTRTSILAFTIGKAGVARQDFERRTGCTLEMYQEGAYAIRGPVLGVVEGVKNLQNKVNKASRSHGFEQITLRAVVPLTPEDDKPGAESQIGPESDGKDVRRAQELEQDDERTDADTAPANQSSATSAFRKIGIPQGSEPYFLRVAIPSHPNPAKRLSPHVSGEGGSTLRSISERTDCMLMLIQEGDVLELQGRKTAVLEARDAVQKVIFDVCNLDQVRPAWLNDLAPLMTVAEHEETEQTQRTEDLKLALRTLTHPVVLVTSALRKNTEQGRDIGFDHCRGVTVSSFTTVTLAPAPIISFNLKVPSRSWDAILDSHRFCVHMLSASPEGAAVAHAFTQPYESSGEPFERLVQLGAFVWREAKAKFARGQPPMINWQGVSCYLNAKLMRDKCVEVGDHVVVVAEVVKVRFPDGIDPQKHREAMESTEGLSYARRGYHGIGVDVEPVEFPRLKEAKRDAGEEIENTTEQRVQTNAIEAGDNIRPSTEEFIATVEDFDRASDPPVDFESIRDLGDEVDDDLATTPEEYEPNRSSVTNGQGHDLSDKPEENVEAIAGNDVTTDLSSASSTLQSEEDVMDKYFEQAQEDDSDDVASPSIKGQSPSIPAPAEHSSVGPKRGSAHVKPLLTSSFSTFAKNFSTMRSYSTTLAGERSASSGEGNQTQPVSQVADPAILSSTVGDFLGVSDEYITPPRFREILRAKQQAADASRRLEQALADGSLTAEESARLEDVIARNERRVAKKLAFRSAEDLRRMLDKGRVDVRRAQWLESSIEKGQAVLLDEAKQLRGLLDRGMIGTERFRLVKETLEQQNQVLSTETMRLRQMVDEDADGGATPAHDANNGRPGFDGFRGNM